MRFALIAGLVTLLSAVAAEAQTPRTPRGYFDITMVGAQPTGDFGLIVDEGWGLELGGRYELDPAGLLSVRGSLGFINYGSERLRFCSVYSCRVGVDHNGVTTYLREGDIVDRPDGSIVIFPRRSEANLWSFRLGVSIGLGSADSGL